jgi:predicted DNA-binding protein
MADTTQISAHISLDTKERLERYVRATGVTRAHLIEQALLHHLQALEELPVDAIIPTRLVLSRESAKRVRDLISRPDPPTEAMQQLFDDR